MGDHESAGTEGRLAALDRRLSEIERRLAALERAAAPGTPLPAPAPDEGGDAPAAEDRDAAAGRWVSIDTLPLYGRTLVALGGAFLLRAATEAGVVRDIVGTALGFLYALFWVGWAYRASTAGRRRRATLHGLLGLVIALPLLWEATVRFEFLSPVQGAVALYVIVALALAVAGRARLQPLAWLGAIGGVVALLGLAVSTGFWTLFVFELLALAMAAIWLGYTRSWRALAWTVAGVTSATIALMTAIVLLASPERAMSLFAPDSIVAIQLSWVVIVFASLAFHSVRSQRDVSFGEIAVGLGTLGVGLGGAAIVVRSTWVSSATLVPVGLALAGFFYGLAFVHADRKLARRRDFVFQSTVGLAATMLTSGSVLRGTGLAMTLSVAALVTTWLGARRSRATLSVHAAAYISVAAASSGLLGGAFAAFASSAGPDPSWLRWDVAVVIAIAAVFCWLPVAAHGRTWGRFSRTPKVVVLAVLLLALGGALESALAIVAGIGHDAGSLAATRTGVISLSAVVLAIAGRWSRLREARWFVYPALVVGAAKLLLIDAPLGEPAALFFSFVLYGVALILAPRLNRRDSTAI